MARTSLTAIEIGVIEGAIRQLEIASNEFDTVNEHTGSRAWEGNADACRFQARNLKRLLAEECGRCSDTKVVGDGAGRIMPCPSCAPPRRSSIEWRGAEVGSAVEA